MAKNDYRIIILDSTHAEIGELREYDSLQAKAPFNSAGSWSLNTTLNNIDISWFTLGNSIAIRRNGQNSDIFTGPMIYFKEDWTTDFTKIKVAGINDLGLLAARRVIPEPDTEMPPYETDEFHVETGIGGTVMHTYVNKHAGDGARAGRKIPFITEGTDLALGETVTGKGRFNNLLIFLQKLALESGDLGFTMMNREFSVYQPQDLTGSIIFSRELGNIEKYSYELRYPKANFGFTGGSGEGTSRTFVDRGDSASIATYDLWEEFLEQNNTNVIADLVTFADAELNKQGAIASVAIQPSEDSGLRYTEDYNLGDRILVRIRQNDIENIIREVKMRFTPQEAIIQPVIGPVSALNDRLISNLIFANRATVDRIRNLETV